MEGAELAALTGAQETLGDNAPLLLVELKEAIFQSLGTDRSAIQEFLNRWGYRPAGLVRGRWTLCGDVQEVVSRNVLWLQPDLPRHREKAARALLGKSNQDGLKSLKESSGAGLTSGTLVSLVFVIS